MFRRFPFGYFCDRYGMWADDVPDLTEGQNDCNGECEECDWADDIYEEN